MKVAGGLARGAMHPVTLEFPDPGLERELRAELAETSRRPTRVTFGIIALIYLAFGVLDRAVLPGEVVPALMWIRIAVVAALAAAIGSTWHAAWPRLRSWVVGWATLASTAGLLGIMVTQGAGYGLTIYSGIGLVVLGVCALFRLRVPVAAGISLAVTAAWLGAALAIDIPREEILSGVFFVGTSVVLGVVAAYTIERYARRAFLHDRAERAERERAERLLLNVLPASVAERLKSEPGPIAERHPEASVLFADIAGFTGLSRRMAPEDLVAMLDEVFTEFDEIAARHGLEKIKTIGDAYMAVAGVPEPAPDHLERVADAALEMRRRVAARADRGPDGGAGSPDGPLELRIGIDTGPVVAGVIGRSKFIYDLWGDPVTTASRMESHGLPGAIHVTRRVKERLADGWSFRPRGEIEVKGLGRMETWVLEGREAGANERSGEAPDAPA